MILMKNVAVHTKSGRSIGVFNVPAWQFITYSKKSKRLGRQSIVKEAADPLPQQQKKMRQSLRSLFVRKKMNLVLTIPSGKLYPGYRSANHQFLGQGKEPSMLQTFKNTSDEFAMS